MAEEKGNLDIKKILTSIINKAVKVSNGKLGYAKSINKAKLTCDVHPLDGSPVMSEARISQGDVMVEGSLVAVVPTPLEDSKESEWAVSAIFDYEERHIIAKKDVILETKEGVIYIGSKDADDFILKILSILSRDKLLSSLEI